MTDILITLLLGAMLGFPLGILITKSHMQDLAAMTPCAQYNPETSDFEWLE